VHLGGWKQEPMQELNFQSFQKAVDICLNEKLDFVLISGDLFDSAYPPIEVLKKTFAEFKKFKDKNLPCFIIAGSHDYSVSGKTFLDVLEKTGFCKNTFDCEEKDGDLILHPTIHEGVAIYGYPGKKTGLEVPELRRVKLDDAPGMFKIFMLHTTIDKVVGSLPIDAIEADSLPKADYYALGHIHVVFQYKNFVYPSPIYPNNFQELEDLNHGRFCIVDTSLPPEKSLRRIDLKIKDVIKFDIEVKDANTATEQIISEIEKKEIGDKIVLLRIRGVLENGKNSDIKFSQIEEFVKRKNAYFMLKNTHNLETKEPDLELEVDVKDSKNIEEESIKIYSSQNPSDFNTMIPQLINSLSIDKQEDEKTEIFTNRVVEESRKILGF